MIHLRRWQHVERREERGGGGKSALGSVLERGKDDGRGVAGQDVGGERGFVLSGMSGSVKAEGDMCERGDAGRWQKGRSSGAGVLQAGTGQRRRQGGGREGDGGRTGRIHEGRGGRAGWTQGGSHKASFCFGLPLLERAYDTEAPDDALLLGVDGDVARERGGLQ